MRRRKRQRTQNQWLDKLDRLRIYDDSKRGRAPNKPLLLLQAFADSAGGKPRLQPYLHYHRHVAQLLRDFGPPRKSVHPEYPFWYLRTDDLWVVESDRQLTHRKDKQQPTLASLKDPANNARGGLPEDLYQLVQSNPSFRSEAIQLLLDRHFPPSLHEEILLTVGLDLIPGETARIRSSTFRADILRAYGARCAVCGLGVQIGSGQLVDAAHIRWFTHDGPDDVQNGIALCPVHHRAFDIGAFTLTHDLELRLSHKLSGGHGYKEYFGKFHKRKVSGPRSVAEAPRPSFLDWHRKQVFKEPEFSG